ncbi:MAG: fused MFS/spermidine synthase [Myxococcales bacterium]|nr:fused MFS/spermidine synthase [Myxococcales bacterium]
MSFRIAALVAFFGGFIALSFEILWFRVYGFATGGTAPAFGVVLGSYLLGIALGSVATRRFCTDRIDRGDTALLRLPAVLLVLASLGGFALVPLIAWMVTVTTWPWTLIGVGLLSGTLGAVLPLVSHLGIAPDDDAGRRMSWLYMANIAGSTLGSLLTGFVLLDTLGVRDASVVLTVVGLLMGAVLVLVSGPTATQQKRWISGLIITAIAASAGAAPLYDGVWERLQFRKKYDGERFAHVIENKSGVITVRKGGEIYGGGVYDGVFSTSLVKDKNMIIRAYALAGYHKAPKEVLMIGLSSGSWAQVVANVPGVERLTIIEINPGYLEIMPKYPAVKTLLQNPKIKVVIDDGRRWMLAHKDRKFDAIVMNTSWHWRAHSTNLLGQQFAELAKSRLKPGGTFQYNTTSSVHVERTGCEVFPFGFKLVNNLVLSNTPVQLDRGRWRQALLAMRIDGKPIFDANDPAHMTRLDEVLALRKPGLKPGQKSTWFRPCADLLKAHRKAKHPIVTEDNLLIEFSRPWDWTQ